MSADVRARHGRRRRNGCRAFTVLELMIVCGLVAILMSMAIPGYQHYLLRARRSSAIEAVLAAASCQERIYASEFHYDTTRCQAGRDAENYLIRFEPAASTAANTFTVIADALEAQRSDPCGSLSLDQSGARGISGPAAILRRCWEGR